MVGRLIDRWIDSEQKATLYKIKYEVSRKEIKQKIFGFYVNSCKRAMPDREKHRSISPLSTLVCRGNNNQRCTWCHSPCGCLKCSNRSNYPHLTTGSAIFHFLFGFLVFHLKKIVGLEKLQSLWEDTGFLHLLDYICKIQAYLCRNTCTGTSLFDFPSKTGQRYL